MALHPAIPIFRIFDEKMARAFYVDWLKFDVVFEHRFGPDMPLYLGLRRDTLQIHLTEHHGDTTPGTRIRIPVDDVEAFADEVGDGRYSFANPGRPEVMPWGERSLQLTDPFGNRLTFFTGDPS